MAITKFIKDEFPYEIVLSGNPVPQFIWCKETFGTKDAGWCCQMGITFTKIYFKHEEDFMLFKLKWL